MLSSSLRESRASLHWRIASFRFSIASPHRLFTCLSQDMWGIGCVLFETLALFPLFPGGNEADQIERIHKVGGSMRTRDGYRRSTRGRDTSARGWQHDT
jgi:hypothetical protein